MKTNSVEAKIRERATTNLSGRFNLVQMKALKVVEAKHKEVCESVVNYVDSHPIVPMYVALSVGVGTGAFKKEAFDKKYKNFDAARLDAVTDMALSYNKHMGINRKPSDVVWRLANRYYAKKSNNPEDFKRDLKKAKIMDGSRGHFEALCANMGIK